MFCDPQCEPADRYSQLLPGMVYPSFEEGYLYVRNPINARQVGRINLSPKVVDCIVFGQRTRKT